MSGDNSGRQIGTIIGAVVGAYFTGGTSLAYLGPTAGGIAGGAVGSLFDPTIQNQGPRLDDLKVQYSTYGVGIPLLYGTERFGGNVIWSTDKLEQSMTRSAGKGGGVENTSYRYYVQMRLLLCETPRDLSEVSIVQIFQDGKLIYDANSGIPIASALASAENPYAFFTLYQGHADQLPDPVEELYESGPGSVPAYRGVVSISMKGIECPGGRVPQFSFVLSNNATLEPEILNFNTFEDSPAQYTGIIGPSRIAHAATNRQGGNNYTPAYEVGTDYVTQTSSTKTVFASDLNFQALTPATGSQDDPQSVASRFDGSNIIYEAIFHRTGETVAFYNGDYLDGRGHITIGCYDSASERYAVKITNTSQLVVLPTDVYSPAVAGTVSAWCFYNSIVSTTYSTTPGNLRLIQYRLGDDNSWTLVQDIALGTFDTGASTLLLHTDKGLFVHVVDAGVLRFYKVGTSPVLLSNSVLGVFPANLEKTFYCDDKYAIVGPFYDSGDASYTMIRHSASFTTAVKVSDIIADLCERAGETRYDVSGIPDSETVIGYKLSNPASARANIDPLLTHSALYIVDEDGLIKFKQFEDITSVADISFDELGQAEDGAEPGDPMPLVRKQEIDLPASVTCSYIEPLADYQTASEKELRLVTEATEDQIINLPVATTSDKAKKVAQMVLYQQWRSQNTRSLKVSRKFAYFSPGDGCTVEYPRGTFRLWRITSMTDTGALIEMTVEPGDASLYTQTAVGATGYVGQQVSALPSPTLMLLLDSPIMRDEDNNAGLYVAAEGYGANWRGYTLWVGDDDTSLQDRGTVTTPCPIGFAESVLGSWTPNMLDGTNSVTLNMGEDVLSSTTEALLMTSRVNLALIGDNGRWEAIQFLTASSLGSGRYLIYGLLRGLFGTERFRSTHLANDKFVLITPAGMLRPNQDVGSLGQSMQYRPVSLGRSLESVSSTSFANTGVGLLPYSPWDARKSKAASNDQTITWERRSRLSTNALRGIVPLGEATESYSIEFYTSSGFTTLAGTLTSTTKSLTITSAQQTAFGLTPGATLYVHIRQVSDVVGVGAPLEATL